MFDIHLYLSYNTEKYNNTKAAMAMLSHLVFMTVNLSFLILFNIDLVILSGFTFLCILKAQCCCEIIITRSTTNNTVFS